MNLSRPVHFHRRLSLFRTAVTVAVIAAAAAPAAVAMAVPPSAASPPPTSSSSSTTAGGDRPLRLLRPYDPADPADASALDEICSDVYGGSDYLPAAAASYASDPTCSFLVLSEHPPRPSPAAAGGGEGEKGRSIAAVGNYRRLTSRNAAWIEGIRTHPRRRGRGAATELLHAFVDLARGEDGDGREGGGGTAAATVAAAAPKATAVYTCTVESNAPMRRALERAGFTLSPGAGMSILSFDELKTLPGWAASPKDDPTDETTPPQTLLAALDLERYVRPSARIHAPLSSSSPRRWKEVRTMDELSSELDRVRCRGGSGFMPALYELIAPEKCRRDLTESLDRGLIFRLSGERTDDDDDDDDEIGPAIVALLRDKRISSLRSPWVCSVSAKTGLALEAALWHACSDDVVRRMNDGGYGDGDAVSQFCLSFDAAIPLTEGTLASKLPLAKDPCVVYSWNEEGKSELDP